MKTLIVFLFGLGLGAGLYSVADIVTHKEPEPLRPCPDGAISTVVMQGEQYCSYMDGRYQAKIKWVKP